MRISCHTCKQIWEVPDASSFAARLMFGLGQLQRTFVCPHCQSRSVVSKQEYDTSDPQIAVVGKPEQSMASGAHPPRAQNDPASAPLNPVPSPDPIGGVIDAHVLAPGLRLLREHNPRSETMGTLHEGENIVILDTWSDGQDIWVQLGPERWATMEENGEARIQLLDQE